MTSLGRSPLKPKESSGRNSFLTAGDIAAESEAQSKVEPALTIVDDGAYQIDVDQPAREAPILIAQARLAELPQPKANGQAPTPPRPPREKKIREPKPPREKKIREPKPAREPKPKAEKAPKPARTPKPPRTRTSRSAVRLTLVAGIIGAVGLILSVVLAVGALFIALDAAQGSAFFGHLSDLCDALVGPLKDVFTFSGANADKKESLVGWGLGSMGYLLIGRFVQSVLQSKVPES